MRRNESLGMTRILSCPRIGRLVLLLLGAITDLDGYKTFKSLERVRPEEKSIGGAGRRFDMSIRGSPLEISSFKT